MIDRVNSAVNGAQIATQAIPASIAELAERINAEHRAVEDCTRNGLQHAKLAGEMLTAVKRQSGHGNWLPWLEQHFKGTVRTAQNYMRVAEQWETLTANTKRVSYLALRDGLRLLSANDEESNEETTSDVDEAEAGGIEDCESPPSRHHPPTQYRDAAAPGEKPVAPSSARKSAILEAAHLYQAAERHCRAAVSAFSALEATPIYSENTKRKESTGFLALADRLERERPVVCPSCDGAEPSPDNEDCSRCSGQGWLPAEVAP
jgi:hypothetical protein